MANNEGTYLQNQWLNWYKATSTATAPSTVYIALFTTQPANDGTGGVEVSGGSYARFAQPHASWGGTSGSNPTQTSNTNTINFTQATASWGTIVAMGIYDASSGGNLLYVGALASSVVINSGDIFQFAVAAIVVQEGGGACPTGQQTNRLQWLRSFSFYSTLATMYLALFTTAPALDGTGGTEVSGGSYARLAITSSSTWGAISGATPASISNASTLSFVQATADWGTVVAVGLYSASSNGTLHALWTLSSSIIVKSSHIFQIAAGNLSLSQD